MMFPWNRRRIEGLLAASLYEPLSERDQRALDRAMQSDTALRAEYESLRRLVNAVPPAPVESIPNLLPLLRDRLDAPSRRSAGYRWAYAGAAATVVLGLSLGAWYADREGVPPGPIATVKTGAPNTLVSQALAEAEGLLAKQDMPAAYDVLRKALSRQPGDARAGDAQWLAADCAFKLKHYSEAYDACNQLFAEYGASLDGNPDRRTRAINLRDLLAEAKEVDYASLQAFDVAKRDRANTFGALENVAATYAKYHGTEQYALGDLVAKEMAATVAAETGIDINTPAGTLAAYQGAHDRCTSPVAVALLDMKIGDAYLGPLNDRAAAKEHYQRAAENPVLASLATKALRRVE